MTDRRISAGRRGWTHEQRVAGSVSLAFALGLLVVIALSLLGRPSQRRARLAQAEAHVAQAEDSAARLSRQDALRADVVCQGPLLREATTLEDQLKIMGDASHLHQLKIQTMPDPEALKDDLQPVMFSLDGAGDYAAAITLLKAMDAYRPQIVVDKVDLSSRTSFLKLHLDGRVYCQTTAHS